MLLPLGLFAIALSIDDVFGGVIPLSPFEEFGSGVGMSYLKLTIIYIYSILQNFVVTLCISYRFQFV